MHSSSPARTPKLQFTAEQPSTGEFWIPPIKDTHFQGQSISPSKMVGGEKFCLESNPILARDAWRAQTNLVPPSTQRPHRDRDRTVSVSFRGVGQQWTAARAGALGAVDLGMV